MELYKDTVEEIGRRMARTIFADVKLMELYQELEIDWYYHKTWYLHSNQGRLLLRRRLA